MTIHPPVKPFHSCVLGIGKKRKEVETKLKSCVLIYLLADSGSGLFSWVNYNLHLPPPGFDVFCSGESIIVVQEFKDYNVNQKV
jgi:hypothetical protein